MIGTTPPLLLARDREQLDRVVRLVRDGRRGFFVVVCPPELRPPAIRYLAERSGKVIPEPVFVSSHDAMVDWMVALDHKPVESADCVRIETSSVDVLTAMNWHREKLRRAGLVILWLDAVAGLEVVQKHAPDAYSLREAALILAGEGGPKADREGEEPADVRAARLLFELPRSAEERAEAAVELASALHARGRSEDVVAIAQEGLRLIPGERYPADRARVARASLHGWLAQVADGHGQMVESFRSGRRALRELEPDPALRWTELRWSIQLSSSRAPVVEADPDLLREALSSSGAGAHGPPSLPVRQQAARNAERCGRFSRAVDLLTENISSPGIGVWGKGANLLTRCRAWRRAGLFRRAEEDLTAAEEVFLRAGIRGGLAGPDRAWLLRDRGEIASATAVARRLIESTGGSITGAFGMSQLLAAVQHHTGDVRGAIDAMASVIREATDERRDRQVFEACEDLVHLLEQATGAGAVTEPDFARALDTLDSAGKSLIEYAAGEPPWYEVLVPGLRASLLSLALAHHDEAISSARESVSLARSRWKQALPLSTRILVRCLARAARWSDMAPAVADALQAAREADHLRELATVQAHDLVLLLHTAAPKDTLERALSDLQSTFAEMGAPRVEGETWLEVAPFFPPLVTFPDPLEIADRLHDQFLEMPMPGPAARCLEWLGDLYSARRDHPRAETCYRLALGTLVRYGLLLRKPLLERKLALPPPA